MEKIIFDDLKNCVTDGRTDGQTDGRTDGWTVGRTDGRREVLPDGRWNISRYLMPKKAYTYLYLFKKWIFGNFKTLTDRQTDGRMEGLTDGWTVRWIDSSFWMKGSTKNKKKTNKITLKVCFPLHGLSCHAYPRSTLLGPNRGPWNQKNALDLLKNSHPTLFTLITNRKNKKKANLIFVLLYHWASPYVESLGHQSIYLSIYLSSVYIKHFNQ